MSVAEAAEALGVSRAHLYRLIREGQFPHLRIGERVVVPRVALDRLLDVATPSTTTQTEE